jgi:hypothetical protein
MSQKLVSNILVPTPDLERLSVPEVPPSRLALLNGKLRARADSGTAGRATRPEQPGMARARHRSACGAIQEPDLQRSWAPTALRPGRSFSRPDRRPRSGHSATSRCRPGLVGGRRSGGSRMSKERSCLARTLRGKRGLETDLDVHQLGDRASSLCMRGD